MIASVMVSIAWAVVQRCKSTVCSESVDNTREGADASLGERGWHCCSRQRRGGRCSPMFHSHVQQTRTRSGRCSLCMTARRPFAQVKL